VQTQPGLNQNQMWLEKRVFGACGVMMVDHLQVLHTKFLVNAGGTDAAEDVKGGADVDPEVICRIDLLGE
jgi:hypothetical protein